MAQIHLIVKYEKLGDGHEAVTLVIRGASKDLKIIHGRTAAERFADKRLIRPFLCGETILIIPCGEYCTDHIRFREIADTLLAGFEFTIEFADQKPWADPAVVALAALPLSPRTEEEYRNVPPSPSAPRVLFSQIQPQL